MFVNLEDLKELSSPNMQKILKIIYKPEDIPENSTHLFQASGHHINLCTLNINPLPPSDPDRKQKKIFYSIFPVQYCHNLKKNSLPWKPEF